MAEAKPSRDQKRAQAAYLCVKRLRDGGEASAKEEYKSRCLSLPALIQQCGLCQSLAFLEAKGAGKEGKKQALRLLDDLREVSLLAEDREKMTARARTAGVEEYQWMTLEAMASAQWLKRYTEALLKD